jgi:hypothetical protein
VNLPVLFDSVPCKLQLTLTLWYLVFFLTLLCLQKAAKRKKIHAFKSKARFEQLEFAQNKRQNAWQQFQTKGKSKKVAS